MIRAAFRVHPARSPAPAHRAAPRGRRPTGPTRGRPSSRSTETFRGPCAGSLGRRTAGFRRLTRTALSQRACTRACIQAAYRSRAALQAHAGHLQMAERALRGASLRAPPGGSASLGRAPLNGRGRHPLGQQLMSPPQQTTRPRPPPRPWPVRGAGEPTVASAVGILPVAGVLLAAAEALRTAATAPPPPPGRKARPMAAGAASLR